MAFKKRIVTKPLTKLAFIFGCVLVATTEPLFENDHYRYLWEGRVVTAGKNPYTLAPKSPELDAIAFNARDKIGFSNLPTVYPPVALIWFGVASFLTSDYRIGLFILVVFNSLLIYLLIKSLEPFLKSSWPLLLTLPLLQKEFIQSVHIDLLAFFFVLPILLGLLRPLYIRYFLASALVFLSIFSKVIGIFYIFPLFLTYFKKMKGKFSFWVILFMLVFSYPAFLYYLETMEGLKGLKAFSGKWIWNPGFYAILTDIFKFNAELARKTSMGFFLFFVFILVIRTLGVYLKNGCQFDRRKLWILSYLFYGSLCFFTPVYNAWYVIWYLVPAILLNLKFGVLYAVFSFTCYTSYYQYSLIPYGEFLGHIFFIFSLVEMAKMTNSEGLRTLAKNQ